MRYYLIMLAICFSRMAFGGEQPTNYLSFYLLAETIPSDALVNTNIVPDGLRLMPTPILSDADLREFDWSNHTFVITAEAAKRLSSNLYKMDGFDGRPFTYESGYIGYHLCGPDTPFVLVASGERVYVGIFSSSYSSSGYMVPFVWPDGPAFLSVSATNDVKFKIMITRLSPEYLAMFGFTNTWVDVREDKRILAALQKLSIRTNAPSITNVPAKQ